MTTSDQLLQRVHQGLADNKSEVTIARELGIPLSQVLHLKATPCPAVGTISEDGVPLTYAQVPSTLAATATQVTRTQTTQTLVVQHKQNGQLGPVGPVQAFDPKEILARRINDLDRLVEIAYNEYVADPTSDSGYNAVAALAKTMQGLIKDAQELQDPRAMAESVVTKILRPQYMNTMKVIVAQFHRTNQELSITLVSKTQRETLMESLKSTVKAVNESLTTEYNRGVRTLEAIFEIPLTDLYLTKKESENELGIAAK